MSVKVEFSRNLNGRQGAMQDALDGLAGKIAVMLARVVRERGDTGGGWGAYSTRRHAYDISPTYPVKPAGGGKLRADGVQVWVSSAAYHAAAGGKLGNVSGGMWNGLSAVISGRSSARVLFRGRSSGQRPNPRRTKSGKAKGLKVSNALKAYSVLRRTGFNVLDLTDDEREQVQQLVLEWVEAGIEDELLAGVVFPKSFDTSFLK